MYKHVLTAALSIAFLLPLKALSQPGGAFYWCNYEGDECNVNIGNNHAVAIAYWSNYLRYLLTVSSYEFSESKYLKSSQDGEKKVIFNTSDFQDLFWGEYINMGLCIGGEQCGHNNSLIFPVDNSSGRRITKIVVNGHDNVGQKTDAALALYHGSTRLGLIDVKKAGGDYTFVIQNQPTMPLRLQSVRKDGNTSSGDETLIKRITIYTNDITVEQVIYPGSESCSWVYATNSYGYDIYNFNCSASGNVAQKNIGYPGSYGSRGYSCNITSKSGFEVSTTGTGSGDTQCDVTKVVKK